MKANRTPRRADVKKGRKRKEVTLALDRRLKVTPAVRTDKVARARNLLRDEAYPPVSVVRSVSEHLAAKLA